MYQFGTKGVPSCCISIIESRKRVLTESLVITVVYPIHKIGYSYFTIMNLVLWLKKKNLPTKDMLKKIPQLFFGLKPSLIPLLTYFEIAEHKNVFSLGINCLTQMLGNFFFLAT